MIGTRKGLILIFDYQQNLRHIIGQGTKAVQCGAITSLAISADHTSVAAGHADGTIFTWEVSRSARPFLTIPPISRSQAGTKGHDGHVFGAAVIHIGFLGIRHTALVSANDIGMAFSHLATRGTGPLGRRIKTTRILGRYPDDLSLAGRKRKPSSVLAFSPLPLGNVDQATDPMGLVAMLTPYLLVIVSTTPVAETQYKVGRPKEMAAHSALSACLAWFPAIRLKGTDSGISKTKLVYCWANILTVLEVTEIPPDPVDPDKPPTFAFQPQNRWRANESIVAVQWISRSVLAVLTITQQLLILEDKSLRVTDSFDLVSRQIYHEDHFSKQLHSLVETLDEEDDSMHGVVSDAFYMSFRSYKGRLFLLGVNDISVGNLSNWAERLYALMEASHFISAIRLAKSYYAGDSEKLTVGLPEDNEARHAMVQDKLLHMMSASVRYVFDKIGVQYPVRFDADYVRDLADACITACLVLDHREFLFDEIYELYEDHKHVGIFMDALEPYIIEGDIKSLPPSAIKHLVAHYSKTRTADHLEEILCLLDTSSMDIDQVTSLCKSHNLYDAYIYVWTQALKDYVGPLIELLSIIDSEQGVNNSDLANDVDNAMKIFPYMSYILTGRSYPTGDELEAADALRAKTDIYRYLFSSNSNERRFGNLRRVLHFDAASFMSMLNEAFEDNFLNDSTHQAELLDGTTDRFSINRQYIISILFEVMETGSEFDVLNTIFLDMFIARNLPKYSQYILLPGSSLDDLLLRLCDYPSQDMREDCQLSAEYLLSIYHPPNIQALIPALRAARFYRILKSVYRAEKQYAELVMTYFDDHDEKESVFTTIRGCLHRGSALTTKQRQKVIDVVRAHIMDLVIVNVRETAWLIQDVAPELHQQFVQALKHDGKSQYGYLKALLEPSEQRHRAQRQLSQSLLETYVTLMCTYDSQHVADFIDKLWETRNDLQLSIDTVLLVMEDRGVIDGAIVLLTRRGEFRRAMDRLTQHLQTLKVGLVGILGSSEDKHEEEMALMSSLEKFGRVGFWLCQRLEEKTAARHQDRQYAFAENKVLTARDRAAALKRPLNFSESLWLDLIETMVDIARSVAEYKRALESKGDLNGEARNSPPALPRKKDPVSPLHGLVQQVFSALLTLTSERGAAAKRTDLTFLRILRAFLARAASTSPSLHELRSVLRSIFSAYTYEKSLLSLANSMLDKDLFLQVNEIAQMRCRGWRPKGRSCYLCRQRVWGPGAGEQIWAAWESKYKDGLKRVTAASTLTSTASKVYVSLDAPDIKDKGKGVESAALLADGEPTGGAKTAAKPAGNAIAAEMDPQNLDLHSRKLPQPSQPSPLVIFSCRHVYHQTCLLRDHEQRVSNLSISEPTLTANQVVFRCPRCLASHSGDEADYLGIFTPLGNLRVWDIANAFKMFHNCREVSVSINDNCSASDLYTLYVWSLRFSDSAESRLFAVTNRGTKQLAWKVVQHHLGRIGSPASLNTLFVIVRRFRPTYQNAAIPRNGSSSHEVYPPACRAYVQGIMMRTQFNMVALVAAAIPIMATNYVLQDDYQPSTWADNFTVFNAADPSGGYVKYVDAQTAYQEGMLGIKDNAIHIGVDHTNIADAPGRRSVRLQSRGVYDHGLIVADIGHMPDDVCGTWPAFWTTGGKWPDDGEIDIIEGVNVQDNLESALHVGPGCKVDRNQEMIGTMQTDDCYVFSPDQPGNQGCVVDAPRGVGYGRNFNKDGGAVLATEITKDAVQIWYFPRSQIPAELKNGATSVDTAKWGKPMSRFAGGCDFEEKIKDQTIIFNTAFCGDWARNRWQESGCSAMAASCEDYVKNNPEAFKEVYWSINWVKVFQQGDAPSAPPAQPALPASSASTAPSAPPDPWTPPALSTEKPNTPKVEQPETTEQVQTPVRTITPVPPAPTCVENVQSSSSPSPSPSPLPSSPSPSVIPPAVSTAENVQPSSPPSSSPSPSVIPPAVSTAENVQPSSAPASSPSPSLPPLPNKPTACTTYVIKKTFTRLVTRPQEQRRAMQTLAPINA
ncbi:Vacuolar protein sorting-associated protein 8 [Ascosphaera aggregata]|nr:Vacuolar protein sorting-associated protein 8 [Ascosphaera aggregata]